ncbi:MAG: SDR family oxidoreductase, partial [Pseudomonadota bacterium]
PGAIRTPMWDQMLGEGPNREAVAAAIAADTPMRRFGTVEEVAAVCAMLASHEAAYMTGANIAIDGGLAAGLN